MNEISKKLDFYKREGYDVELCPCCKNYSNIILSEDTDLDDSTRYRLTECVICGLNNKKGVLYE